MTSQSCEAEAWEAFHGLREAWQGTPGGAPTSMARPSLLASASGPPSNCEDLEGTSLRSRTIAKIPHACALCFIMQPSKTWPPSTPPRTRLTAVGADTFTAKAEHLTKSHTLEQQSCRRRQQAVRAEDGRAP